MIKEILTLIIVSCCILQVAYSQDSIPADSTSLNLNNNKVNTSNIQTILDSNQFEMIEISEDINKKNQKTQEAKPTLQKWSNISSIISSILSLLAIIITVIFGWLTYQLTIKYGKSEQKVVDLHKIINGIESQRLLTIENSKPRLKDSKITIDKIEDPNKFKFSIIIKNYGYRTAHQIDFKWIFYKLDNTGGIESHGVQSTLTDNQYQNILNPNEEWTYNAVGNLSGGKEDLKTIITRLEIEYLDDQKNKRESYFYYYEFIPKNDHQIKIGTISSSKKELIEKYMSNK